MTSATKNLPATRSTDKVASPAILAGVVACFILSGFAALLYQTAWMRQFSLVFGTSELAIAAVLSAYMGGLALGSNIAGRFVHKITRPVLFYGILEAGIAIAALCVPLFLMLASLVYAGVFGGQPAPVDASGLGQSFFYLIVAFLVLVIPTAFMGATLPLLTKYVVNSNDQVGSRVGMLYATNTAGAIGGTLVAGFILLPALGLSGTVWVGIAVNVLVFVIAALIARTIGDHKALSKPLDAEPAQGSAFDNEQAGIDAEATSQGASQAASTDRAQIKVTPIVDKLTANRFWILPVMLISGANSFVYEVLWTRLLGHVLGGSITAFSTMLAGFLSGIAIGSAIASRFAKTRSQAITLFVAVQIGIAMTSMLIYQLLPGALPDSAGLKGNAPFAFLILLPATIFIGATFPLAVRIFALDEYDAAPASARVYSWNTVGAIFGATVAAFFIIPILKYEGAIKAAVIVNILLALGAAAFLAKGRLVVAGGIMAAVIGVFVVYQPKMPEAILRSSPVYAMPDGEISFYEVGRSATVLVIEAGEYINVRTNGLPEASIIRKGAPVAAHNQYMLSTMPVLARPDIEDMLIVGFGGGNAVEGVPSSVKTIDVIEIEREVIKANQLYGDLRRNDPLSDPRVQVIINDARSALMLTDKNYDAIVSQPSHPWTAGASHLYTREFMQLAEEHLTDDGVYLQWMNTQFIDEFLLKSLCLTMLDVFDHVRVYQWQNEVLFFLGSNEPLNVEADIARTGLPLNNTGFEYLEKGVGSVEDVVVALTMDHDNVERFARGGKVITDNNNYMATLSARAMDNKTVIRGSNKIFDIFESFDPLLQADSAIRKDFPMQLNYAYMSRRFDGMKMKRRGIALANALVADGNPRSLTMIGIGQENQGERAESQKNLRLALNANPDDQQARYSLLLPYLAAILTNEPVPEYIAEQIPLLKGSAAATIAAGRALENNELQNLSQLDRALAAARPTDLWYQTAVKLRATWRIRVTTPSLQPRLFNEATQILDGAISFNVNADMIFLRLQSARAAKDYAKAFETARYRLSLMESEVEYLQSATSDFDAPRFTRQVEYISTMLAEYQEGRFLPEDDLEALAMQADRLARRLERL